MLNVTITESAQTYLAGLLEKQNCEGIGIRMFVSDPGTPKAETCIEPRNLLTAAGCVLRVQVLREI